MADKHLFGGKRPSRPDTQPGFQKEQEHLRTRQFEEPPSFHLTEQREAIPGTTFPAYLIGTYVSSSVPPDNDLLTFLNRDLEMASRRGSGIRYEYGCPAAERLRHNQRTGPQLCDIVYARQLGNNPVEVVSFRDYNSGSAEASLKKRATEYVGAHRGWLGSIAKPKPVPMMPKLRGLVRALDETAEAFRRQGRTIQRIVLKVVADPRLETSTPEERAAFAATFRPKGRERSVWGVAAGPYASRNREHHHEVRDLHYYTPPAPALTFFQQLGAPERPRKIGCHVHDYLIGVSHVKETSMGYW